MQIIRTIIIFLALLPILTNCVSASDEVPINQKWDIAPQNSSFIKEFQITKYYAYDLFIDFHAIHSPWSNAEWTQLNDFTGGGGYGIYDIKNDNWIPSDTPAERERAAAFVQSGTYKWKHENSGIIVPVHLKIEHYNKDGSTGIIMDQVFDTEGNVGTGLRGLSRSITSVKLKPDKYKITISTLKAVTLPANTETFLIMRATPKTRELKDNE